MTKNDTEYVVLSSASIIYFVVMILLWCVFLGLIEL
jgi:hypothetical protein